MKNYFNIIIINGVEFTNKINANNYKEALAIQKVRKKKSKHSFKNHLALLFI